MMYIYIYIYLFFFAFGVFLLCGTDVPGFV